MKLFRFCLAVCLGSAAALSALPAAAQSPVPPALQGAEALVERVCRAKSDIEVDAYLTNHCAAQKIIGIFSLLGYNLPQDFAANKASPEIRALFSRYSITEHQMDAAANFGVVPPPLAAHGRQFLQEYLQLRASSKQGVPTSQLHSSVPPPGSEFTFHVVSATRVVIHPLRLQIRNAKGTRIIPNKSSDDDMEAQLEDGHWYLEEIPDGDSAAPIQPRTAAAAQADAFLLAEEEQDVAGIKNALQKNPALARRPLAFVPDSARSNYNLPLSLAAYLESQEIAVLLIQAGANVNAADADGETALEQAVEAGDTKLAALLLAHGANASTKNQDGRTALHQAALRGDPSLITLLLRHGASINARDRAGDTPLSVALSLPPGLINRAAIIQLRRHGAKK